MNEHPEKKEHAEKSAGGEHPEKPDKNGPAGREKNGDLSVKLEIKVGAAEIADQIDQVARGYSGEVKLPGFRKGNVPLEIIKNRFRQLVTDEALNKLIENRVYEQIQKDNLKIVSRPVVEKMDYKDGGDLLADVVVERFPDISIPDFSGWQVKVQKKELETEPYDEKKEIEGVLERNKRRVPVNDRPIAENDTVLLTQQSSFTDTKRLTKKKDIQFLVNRETDSEIIDLMQELLGKNRGEKLSFHRKYPDDHPKKNWAGKELEHYLEIKNIFEMRKAELTPDFLKSIGFEDEAAFKAKLKEEYQQYVNNQRDEKINDALVSELTTRLDFPTPRTLMEQELTRMMSQYQPILRSMNDKQKTEYLDMLKQNVEKSVRFSLILEAIQRAFKLEISNEELEKEYKKIAENNKFPLAEVRKYYMNSGEKEKLKDALIRNKMMTLLREKIKIKEV